jgi:hypothetical protein
VAHPPCRAWGKYAHLAKPRKDERALALWAIEKVRENGGVLEHPKTSRLWTATGCLSPGIRDQYGGVIVPVLQSWWGHRAPKETFFYIVGPVPPLPAYEPPRTIRSVEDMGHAERERTPPDLARWLVDVARRCERTVTA